MACFWKSSECTLTHLPIFVPNDYLYTTHADKGKEKWEIYAWAIRDIMANGFVDHVLDHKQKNVKNLDDKSIDYTSFCCDKDASKDHGDWSNGTVVH